MRVGIICISHESNTFIRTPTDLECFRELKLLRGAEVREELAEIHHEVGGFLGGLDEAGMEAVPLLAARALPSGRIPHETLEAILAMAYEELDRAGSLDGLLVAPHGAAVSDRHADMDGYWLGQMRQRIGPNIPMICTLDPHANISQRMVDACDATITYRSNPHLDQRQRGLEAARLMAATLRGEIKPTQACARPPMIINIERQNTTEEPCRSMYRLAGEILGRPGVLSNSIALGFQYADVEEMGTTFVVVTDDDQSAAQRHADELAGHLLAHRRDFIGRFVEMDDAIDEALDTDGPVCLLDMGDNVGGGSPADGTWLAHALNRRKVRRAFVSLCDPKAVQRAEAAGIGATLTLQVGGNYDDQHGSQLQSQFTVKSIHDGEFTETQPRHGGHGAFEMGRTAILETAHGLTVQLTSRRTVPFSLGQVRSCDLDPASFKILVAKGVSAPVAAYQEVCNRYIRVNTAGSTCADMSKFTYHHRRKPLFPFEEIG